MLADAPHGLIQMRRAERIVIRNEGVIINDRTVTITFSGQLDIAVVFPAVEAFGDAFRLMIRHQHDVVTGHRPAYPALLSASALRLDSVSAEPCSVTLAIAPPAPLGKLGDAPPDGLSALLTGANADVHGLPMEVAFPLRQIVAGLPDGINAVTVAGPAGLPTLKLTQELFDDGVAQVETVRCYGRLQEINWSRGTAELHSPVGKTLLAFPGTLAERMHEAGNRYLKVVGKGEYTPDGVTIIREIEGIEIIEEHGRSLRTIGPLEEDVRQALAIIRWEEKQSEWFYDDELDAFVDAIQNRKYKDPL